MKGHQNIKLTWWQALSHYAIVPFFLIVPAMAAYDLIKINSGNAGSVTRTESELIWSSAPFLLAAVIFFFLQKQRLRFQEINIHCNKDQFHEAIRRTADDLYWRAEINRTDFFRAHRPSNLTGSWGELITIVRQVDKLLVNSICDPDAPISVGSYGWNKTNIQVFTAHLQDVVHGRPLSFKNRDRFINPKSSKARLIRIFAYFFSLVFIGVGVLCLKGGAWIPGIVLFAFSLGYIYLDIRDR